MFFARQSHSHYDGSYLDFYPSFFQFVSASDYAGIGFNFAHLWFVPSLFTMSLIALPLFIYLRGESGTKLTASIAAILDKPGAIFLLALPLPFLYLFPDPTGHKSALYIAMFTYGYILMSTARFEESVYMSRWIAAVLGVITTLVYFALVLVWDTRGEDTSLPSVMFQFCFNFSTWFWIVAII